ncbi:TetR/AcrR family transcriptional regulator [Haloechinothrix sp. LS1_15]|uniref:TetR/AcrR family transcriptional regulator n=1 Tax=Haloechinothrix sp. LS1_15 TaxID=2652248 RepID=UPI002945DF3F|nr:TetR/AcrR family transcriptional regulator [Haloechinothrix sp. LS1_15]MDV6014063.1 TetR/AcrR family transcriptional regulator [Haloechinothrix sp. LS1_15]
MSRLTRAESQARTREQLVATAKELFLAEGYWATSLEKVAEAAGYSKGAVYSNFRNKDELCLAVLDAIHAEQASRIGRAIAGKHTLEDLLDGFERWAEETIGDQRWTALEVEFATNVRRDERLRDELARRDLAIREGLAELITSSLEEFDVELPMPADDVATALLSLGIGLGVQRAIDPGIPVRVLTNTMRAMLGLPQR